MYLSLIIIPLMFGFASDTGDSWQIALCNIGLFGSSDIIHCNELQDTFILKEGTNITIDLDNSTKTVTFSASGTGTGPNELYCTVGKWFNAYNATTNNFNCETVPTFSDATTASNVGTGEGIFNIEVSDDLRFNSLIGGQGIDAVNTVNDITISTDFKIDTLPTIGIDQFISAFDNSTGDWTTKTFSVNTLSPNNDIFVTGINNVTGLISTNQFSVNTITCSGSDRISAINNVTGLVTCSTGSSSGITSINGDTTGAQIIAGSTNEITIGDVGATHTIDVGTDIVQIDQSNTYSGSNTQSFGSNILTFNSDPAEAGNIRHQNAGQECWEASPTGTDQCVGNDATENYVWDANWNNINFGSNAFINAIFDVAGTGNRLTSTGTALGDILKSDGTDFKRLARGTANQVLQTNSGGTDIAWQTLTGTATSLGADVTCTATATYCAVFTIPMTASSGNTVDGILSADSNTAGGAVQVRGRSDDTGALGWCNFVTPLTASTEALDYFVISTAPTDTGETVWLPSANTPQPIQFRCSLEADATSPQNLIIEIQMEVASTGTVQKGSQYIKTP